MYQDRISQEELDEVFGAGFKAGQMAEAPEIIRCKNCRHNSNCKIQYAAQAGDEFFCGATEKQEDMPPVESKPVSEDTISREALIGEILKDGNGAMLSYPTGIYEDELAELIEKQMIEYFIGVINYAPPVESKQPMGEWINAGVLTVHCSNCKSEFHELEAMNFCPNCGADMRGEEND